MCGICGVFHFRSDAPVDRVVLERMTDVLQHRGPDGEGLHLDDAVGLGHRRLSIIDVSGGAQPLSNEDGTVWITFNGEIYNFKDLRHELEQLGHVFRTFSDTEVIVHGYEEWGDDVVLRLNGIFAFGLWDIQKRRMLLGRDHFGVKPLYFFARNGKLMFASELKSLFLHPDVEVEPDPEGIEQALTYGFVPSPYTLFREIQKLGPGYRLMASEGGVDIERYWRPVPDMLSGQSEADLLEELRKKIDVAVERQMMSDVPVGALLSGGVDSTAIVSLMCRHHQKVRTFSIGVRDEPDSNELAAARETARRLGTQHEEIEIGAEEYMDFLGKSQWHLEEPCTPSALLTYFVCGLAGRSVKVVLTGQGADELFGGYARYLGEGYSALYQRLPDVLTQRLVPELLGLLPGRFRWQRGAYALAEKDPIRRFGRIYEVFSADDQADLFRPEVRARLPERAFNPIRAWAEGLDHLDSLERLLYIDMRCGLADNLLMFGDKMSMAASVEARVPFLDLDLTEFVERIPACIKLKKRRLKYLFKRALEEWMPQDVLTRPKLGFQIPEAKWFQGSMFDYTVDLLLGPDARLGSYLNATVIRKMLNVHRSGRQNLWRHIFSLLSIEMIYRSFVKPTGSSS